MGALLNPDHTVAYDPAADRIVITFRDGRDASVIAMDPEGVPGLINGLMEARRQAKAARKAVPLPPPMVRPATCPPANEADRKPVRLLRRGAR